MYSELYLYEYHLHIHTCWWVTGYMTQSARIQSAKSDLQSCLLFFLEVKVMKLRCRLTWPYGYPGIWSTFYLIFSKPFSGHVTLDLVPSNFSARHLQWISYNFMTPAVMSQSELRQCLWWFGLFSAEMAGSEGGPMQNLRFWRLAGRHPDAKETQVNRKSPWLLGLGIFEKWPKRSTCKWKKHDQCNRSMGFDWHVNVISGF